MSRLYLACFMCLLIAPALCVRPNSPVLQDAPSPHRAAESPQAITARSMPPGLRGKSALQIHAMTLRVLAERLEIADQNSDEGCVADELALVVRVLRGIAADLTSRHTGAALAGVEL